MKLKKILREQTDYRDLSKRIYKFIDKFAGISPNYDPEYDDDEKYIGPDPYELIRAAKQLERGSLPKFPRSDWGSGSYKPYTSTEGKREHDAILTAIKGLSTKWN